MTNIPPISGPSPDDDRWRPDPADGSFSLAMEMGLELSARHAVTMGQSMWRMLPRAALDAHAYEIQTSIQSLFGGALRLAACPQVGPGYISTLSRQLDQISFAGTNRAAAGQIAAQISQTLGTIEQRSGPLGAGAAAALAHAQYFAQRLQARVFVDLSGAPVTILPLLVHDTLALARRLVDATDRDRGQDPLQALLLQGMAGTLHAIAVRVPRGVSQIGKLAVLRETFSAIRDASVAGGQFTNQPYAQLGTELADRIDWVRSSFGGNATPPAGLDQAIASLVADGTALQAAVAARVERFGRPFQH